MILHIYTDKYPLGTQGEPFLEPELPILADHFDKIRIFPLATDTIQRPVPDKVEVIQLATPENLRGGPGLQNLALLSGLLLQDFRDTKDIKLTRTRASYLRKTFLIAQQLEQFIKDHSAASPIIHYSFWFDRWATILGILKRRKTIDHFIARAHRYDLYEEGRPYQKIPFRNFQLKCVNKVFAVSREGADYLQTKYPAFAHKIDLQYLASKTPESPSRWKPSRQLRILSCSRIAPVKRVHLIPEILHHLNIPVKWIHIGEGQERFKVEQQLGRLPDNIEVELLGQYSHRQVLEYYRQQPVDLFINVSESEGLPVSIMEVISYGIPVIATDVGGIQEILNDEVGYIIPKDFNPEEVAYLIRNHHLKLQAGTPPFNSEHIRTHWDKYFNPEKNYVAFAALLKEIHFSLDT